MDNEGIKAQIIWFELASRALELRGKEGHERLMEHKGFEGKSLSILHEDVMKVGELGEATRLAGQSIPGISLWGFTVELCFKAIIEVNGGTPRRTHDLESLFDNCPDAIKERIRELVCTRMKISSEEFSSQLSKSRLVFDVFRYMHEGKSIGKPVQPRFLKSLVLAAKSELGLQ